MNLSEIARKAAVASMNASASARSRGLDNHKPVVNPFALAEYVAMDAVAREIDKLQVEAKTAPKPEKKTPSRLGCWVDGVLKFQSRDHEAVRDYADGKMRPRTVKTNLGYQVATSDVWVAPVGSFAA